VDSLLNHSKVDQARNKAAALDGELLKMKDILNNLPAVLEDFQKDLPYEYEQVKNHYNQVVKSNINVSHLDVAKRLDQIKSLIVDTLRNHNDVFLKELQDVSEHSYHELEAIQKQLEAELRANEVLNKELDILTQIQVKAKIIADKANAQLLEIDGLYTLSKNEVANLKMENELLADFMASKSAVIAQKESGQYIASELVKQAMDLSPKFSTLIIAFEAYIKHIETLRADEKRLLNEYTNMQYIINDTQAKLRDMNLPRISNEYFDTISKAKGLLADVISLLEKKPLNINLVSNKVANAQDVVFKLYDNSRKLLKNAQMAENTIVFGNRYKASYKEVDIMLNKAETLFNNGEYSKSLTAAIEGIEIIHPKIREELFNYKKEQIQSAAIN
jgi:septation ring formation regulator EzrA